MENLWQSLKVIGAVAICWALVIGAAEAQSEKKADFRINDENVITTVGTQDFPGVAASPAGYAVVWEDNRRNVGSDIYAQLYDINGAVIGTGVRVNDEVNDASLGPPRVAMHFPTNVIGDAYGTIVVVWQDPRQDTLGDIYAQLYRHDGVLIGSNFRINEDAVDGRQYQPDVGMWPSPNTLAGRFVVVWTDNRDGNDDVYARIFAGDGTAAGPSFRVNDDTTQERQDSPAVGVAANGDFVVAWRDFRDVRSGVSEVYFQRYTFTGEKAGVNTRVDTLISGAVTPRVAVAGNGSFVVVYTGGSTSRNIFAQRYTKVGVRDGDQVEANEATTLLHFWPDVTWVQNGFIVTWEAVQSGQIPGDVYMQYFDDQASPVGNNTLVSTPALPNQGRPAIATLGFGAAIPGANPNDSIPAGNLSMIVWHDDRVGDLDIWGQLVKDQGDLNGQNFLVNGLVSGGANQTRSALGATPQGGAVVVWQDDRNAASGWDIYGKRLDGAGTLLGADFRINDDIGSADQVEPDIAVGRDRSFMVVWTDYRRDSEGDIDAQRFDANGTPIGSNIVVNDTTGTNGQTTSAVAVSQNGTYVVVWVDKRNQPLGEIFAQIFDADGNRVGGNFRVDSDDSGKLHRDPAVAFSRLGEFVVVWADARDKDLDIWAQRFASDGSELGGNFRVNAVIPGTDNDQILPAVDFAPGGVSFIAWVDYRKSPNGDIFAQRYGSSGPLGDNFQVNDVDNVANPFPQEFALGPSVAAAEVASETDNDNSFVVVWTDFRNSVQAGDIYANYYNNSGGPLGGNVRVDAGPTDTWQSYPDVARDDASANGVYFCWTDDRNPEEGTSIWGKIFEIRKADFKTPDFDGNGKVDFADFLDFAQNFGKKQGDVTFDDRFDLNNDGEVNFTDFITFVESFGKNFGAS